MYKIKFFLSLFLVFLSCTKKHELHSPDLVLESYVKTAINAKSGSDRSSLFVYLTGDALERLKKMSDKEFFDTLVKPKYKFVHFSTRHFQKQKGNAASLVYELVYKNDEQGEEVPVQVTVRKVAYFIKVRENEWKISDTKNVKSFIEIKKGMEVQYP